MDNGHVKVHNLISDNNNQTTKLKPGSDMEDSEEFKLLRAYAQRRRPNQTQPGTGDLNGSVDANAASPPADKIQTEKDENEKTKKKKKKSVGKPLRFFTKCIRPQADETEPPPAAEDNNVSGRPLMSRAQSGLPVLKFMGASGLDEDEMQDVAARVVEITDEIEFVPSDIEADNPEDEVERTVALILRESGDQLNERFKEANLSLELFSNYDFFRRVVVAFLERIGFRSRDPEALGPQASPRTQIAVTCEITSRLSALDTQPTNRLLNHGAQFLQDYYSTWAQQHGGYEAVFQGEDDEEVD